MERNYTTMAHDAAIAARDAFGEFYTPADTALEFCAQVEADEPGTYPDFADPVPTADWWKLKDAYVAEWNALARQAREKVQ